MAHRNIYAIGAGWREMLASVGVDDADVLRRAALPEDLLNREDVKLDVDAFFRFAEALDTSLPDATFWVRLTEAMKPEFFSPPIFASLCSPNLTVAAQRLQLFKPLLGPITMDVEVSDDGLRLGYRWKDATTAPPPYMHAVEALFVVQLARMGTRHRVCPAAVVVPQRPQQPQPFEEFLGVKLQQGDSGIRVVFHKDDAERPFMTASSEMWSIFEPELKRRLADLKADAAFADRVQAVLLEAIPSGQVGMHQVAKRLAVSSRTLQRRLREEATSYKHVLRSTRERLARHYLRRTHLTATEIAYLLGFDEPTSFFRAFRNWTGASPEALRRRLVADASAVA